MSQKGFTLIEFAMISIIIIMTGIIIAPKITQSIRSWDLETESKSMRSKIREAQLLAATNQRTYRVQFDTINEAYSIGYMNPAYVLLETVNLKDNVEIVSTSFTNPSANTLDFDTFGAPSEAGTVTLVNAASENLVVGVVAATGKVTIQ